jgi:hypothetical protein
MLAGSHASSTLEVLAGSVDVSAFPGETSRYVTLTIRGGSVRTSDGCTLTTVALEGSGRLADDSAITTLTMKGSSSIVTSGAMTTATIEGDASLDADSTITTLKMSGNAAARVTGAITTANVDGNASLNAESAITTLTSADRGAVTMREGGSGTATTIYGSSLTIVNSSSATYATLVMGTNSTLDLSESEAAVTVTADMAPGAGITIIDPMGRLAATVKPAGGGLQDIKKWTTKKGATIDVT